MFRVLYIGVLYFLVLISAGKADERVLIGGVYPVTDYSEATTAELEVAATRAMIARINEDGIRVGGEMVRFDLAIRSFQNSRRDTEAQIERAVDSLVVREEARLILGPSAPGASEVLVRRSVTKDGVVQILPRAPDGGLPDDMRGVTYALLPAHAAWADNILEFAQRNLDATSVSDLDITVVDGSGARSEPFKPLLRRLDQAGAKSLEVIEAKAWREGRGFGSRGGDVVIVTAPDMVAGVRRIEQRMAVFLGGCPRLDRVAQPNLVRAVCVADWHLGLEWGGRLPSGEYYDTQAFLGDLRAARDAERPMTPQALSAAAAAAAGVLVFAEAIKRAESTDPAKIARALDELDILSFFGPITFDNQRINSGRLPVVFRPDGSEDDGGDRCHKNGMCEQGCPNDPDCKKEQ